MAELWLTPVQASRELGVSERTVRRWIVEGRLRGQKIKHGKKAMWRVERLSVLAVKEDRGGEEPAGTVESGADRGEAGLVQSGEAVSALQMDAVVREIRSLREENAEYRRVIEIQAGAVERLRQEVTELRGLIERALPPPREEETVEVVEPEEPEPPSAPTPWWRWLWPF